MIARYLFLFPLLLAACASSVSGVVIDKYQNHKVTITVNQPLDPGGFVYHRIQYKYPARYFIWYKDIKDEKYICEVNRFIFETTQTGDPFDCSLLGKVATERTNSYIDSY